jgi:hypothetical protein
MTLSTLLITASIFASIFASNPDGTCSTHGDCKRGERCEHRECIPHKPHNSGEVASDCNPGRKDPPKEGDKTPPPVYNPKV